MAFHLAQLNVGTLLAPLDDAQIADFADALEPINALADAAPGFVWRLQTEDGDATAVKVAPDPLFIINLTVWESLESLAEFVYSGEHRAILRERRRFFQRVTEPIFVLWWIPAGTVPTPAAALARLDRLRAEGPGPEAFTFRHPFPPPGLDTRPPRPDDHWTCPA
jgi:heme-degrading monooxygenase HmoA